MQITYPGVDIVWCHGEGAVERGSYERGVGECLEARRRGRQNGWIDARACPSMRLA